MAGYWPRSFFASLWTSTPSRSIITQKKNLAGQYLATFTSHLVNNPYTPLTTLFNLTLERAQTVTLTTNSKQTKQVARSKRHSHDCSTWRSHEKHVIRTCFIDLWFRHVILGLVQEIHQLTVKFALFRLDVLHKQNWIFTRLCLVLLLFVFIYPFLFK